MKRWRWIIIVSIVGILIWLIIFSWSNWQPWKQVNLLNHSWQSTIQSMEFPYQVQPHTFIRLVGAFFTLYLVGILVIYMIPKRIRFMESTLLGSKRKLLNMGLLGALSGLLLLAVGIGSAMMMTTFPLTIIVTSGLFLCGFIGYVALTYTAGHWLLKRAAWENASPLLAQLVGLFILFGAGFIPVLGVVLNIIFASLGLGVVIATRFGNGGPWNLEDLQIE